MDVEIEGSRGASDRTATIPKMKDGEGGQKFGFKLAVVQLGLDEEGDPVSSCVVEHGEVVPKGSGREPKGANERTVWRVAGEMQGLDGTGPGIKELLDRCVNETPFDDGSGKRDRRRENLNRALNELISATKLQIEGGQIRLGTTA